MSKRSYRRISDGASVTEDEAIDARGTLRDGYALAFSVSMMDSAGGRHALRDSAGVPITLHDEQTGAQLKLNTDLIAAIEAEAEKLSMSVSNYVKEVLRYSWSAAKLSGSDNPDSPSRQETE